VDLTYVHQFCHPGFPPDGPFVLHFLVDGTQDLGTATTQPYDPCAHEFTTATLNTTQVPAGRHWIVVKDDTGLIFKQFATFVLCPVPHGGTLENLYRFLLNRPLDPSGAAYFAGKPSSYVAAALESSPERHRLVVNELLYPRYLNRDADPPGSNYFATLLDSGMSERTVTAIIEASDEYAGFDSSVIPPAPMSLYLDDLNRFASTAESDYWKGQMASAGVGPAVNAIVYSDEASERIVDSAYNLYLQRQAGPSERAYWVGAMRSGLTVEGFTVNVLSSPEFAARWS
jgi:hypothetical protein